MILAALSLAFAGTTDEELGTYPLAPVPPPPGMLAAGSLHGAEEGRVRFWHVPEKLPGFEDDPRAILDYAEVVNRLDVTGGNDRLTVGARVDGVALLGNQYMLDGELFHERDLIGDGLASPFDDAFVTLEKIYLESRGTRGRVTIGDGYVSFGRGLALNLVKNTEIDVDTSLRGAHAVIETDNWSVTVVTGIANPQQVALENPNINLLPDVRHALTGVRVERYGLGVLNVGSHGYVAQFARAPNDPSGPLAAYGQGPDVRVGGATIEAVGVGGLDLYAEADWFAYSAAEIPVESGHALYASASAYPGRAILLVEARRSKDAEYVNAFNTAYEIAAGPTLEYERVVTEDSSAAVNSNDITGARVRADLRLGDDARGVTLLPYLSFAAFRDAAPGGLHFNRAPETILHPVAGVQYIEGEVHVLANAGCRVDMRDDFQGADLGADRAIHADADISVPVAGRVSIELAPSVLQFHWGANAVQQADYLDLSNALAVKVGSPWAFILYTDYSNNPLLPTDGNVSEPVYAALEAQWMPGSATTIKAFYGAYRGGIRCAGGQCRSLPGFEGVKFSVSSTF